MGLTDGVGLERALADVDRVEDRAAEARDDLRDLGGGVLELTQIELVVVLGLEASDLGVHDVLHLWAAARRRHRAGSDLLEGEPPRLRSVHRCSVEAVGLAHRYRAQDSDLRPWFHAWIDFFWLNSAVWWPIS